MQSSLPTPDLYGFLTATNIATPLRGGRRFSLTDGSRRDWRADDFDRAEFAGDSGGVYRGG